MKETVIDKDSKYKDMFEKYRTLKVKIDKDYEFIPKGKFFRFLSYVLCNFIAFPILWIILKIVYDFKIEGKENLKDIENGAISVSNHVLVLDCAMVGLALRHRKVYFTALESQFKIPFIRKLIKLLRAIPIPTGFKNKEYFIKAVKELLKGKNNVHFYPEGSLYPYCEHIRDFRNGAFDLAIRNEVPIIPIVIKFRESTKFRKIFKKKKDVTLKIFPKIEPKDYGNNKILLKENTKKIMEEA